MKSYNMSLLKRKYIYVYAGLSVLGIAGGLLYWNFWGCTDSCPIDSSWKLSMLRGGLIGLSLAAIMHPSRKKSKDNVNQTSNENE